MLVVLVISENQPHWDLISLCGVGNSLGKSTDCLSKERPYLEIALSQKTCFMKMHAFL